MGEKTAIQNGRISHFQRLTFDWVILHSIMNQSSRAQQLLR